MDLQQLWTAIFNDSLLRIIRENTLHEHRISVFEDFEVRFFELVYSMNVLKIVFYKNHKFFVEHFMAANQSSPLFLTGACFGGVTRMPLFLKTILMYQF